MFRGQEQQETQESVWAVSPSLPPPPQAPFWLLGMGWGHDGLCLAFYSLMFLPLRLGSQFSLEILMVPGTAEQILPDINQSHKTAPLVLSQGFPLLCLGPGLFWGIFVPEVEAFSYLPQVSSIISALLCAFSFPSVRVCLDSQTF